MNRVKEVQRINAKDLALQVQSDTVGNAGKWDVNKSWHAQYKDSAYVYVGGLPVDLSEGDIVIIFSQFGEVVDVNIPRDQKTGKSKGFAFIAYEDQRSTVLAVDNFNGAKLLGRTLRCDHCASYNEEQKKDADNLPDHVTRKLSERELEQKRKDIEQRNQELEENNDAKSSSFATGRGTHESEEQREERAIRQEIVQQKEAGAHSKRKQHIEAVLARRKAEARTAITEEARKEEAWVERKKAKEQEALAAVAALPKEGPKLARHVDGGQVVGSAGSMGGAGNSGGKSETAESRWERMMNGGSGKKSKKGHTAPPPPAAERHGEEGRGGKKMGEDSISIEETNRMRAALGMAPLRT